MSNELISDEIQKDKVETEWKYFILLKRIQIYSLKLIKWNVSWTLCNFGEANFLRKFIVINQKYGYVIGRQAMGVNKHRINIAWCEETEGAWCQEMRYTIF